jgi:hypothetical protein
MAEVELEVAGVVRQTRPPPYAAFVISLLVCGSDLCFFP